GFVDYTAFDYTPLTPLERPLGGMQSALCYLSHALAARGHEVWLINKTTAPGLYRSVNCLSMRDELTNTFLWSLDIVVSISVAGLNLRQSRIRCPLVLWTGYDVDQPPVAALANESERNAWSRIVLVSTWQAERYGRTFHIDKQNLCVLRNAIA